VEYHKSRLRYVLKKARDTAKDQSYFLFSLSHEQVARCLFPLGSYTKVEVRKMARAVGLNVEDKPESQNFFAGDYSSLLGPVARTGPIMNKEGEILGWHRGIPFYTVGQRKGLGISFKEPLYVTGIDQEKNVILVGAKDEVYGDELVASELNWIAMEGLWQPLEVKAKVRYQHKEAQALIAPLDNGQVHVKF
jgi:tRNA-specific 2-thiouridylase